jgi:multiple sugar transport system permease protein
MQGSLPVPARAAPRARSLRTTRILRRLVLVLGLAFFLIWTLVPLYWIIATSVKTNTEIYSNASLLPRTFTTVHYEQLLIKTPYATYFKNSLIVSALTTAIAIVIGILGAYAITRLVFKGRTAVARATIITYLVPGSACPSSTWLARCRSARGWPSRISA